MPAHRADDRLPSHNRSLLDIIAEQGRNHAGGGLGRESRDADVPGRPDNPAAAPARLAQQVESILRGQRDRNQGDHSQHVAGRFGERISGPEHVTEFDAGDPVDIRKFALAVSLLGDMARRILAAAEDPSAARQDELPRYSGFPAQAVPDIDRRLDLLAAGLSDMAADIAELRRDLGLSGARGAVVQHRDIGQTLNGSPGLGDLKALRDQLQAVSLDRGRMHR